MKQKLLTDIELDVHGLKYLADLYSKEPTQALFELLKNNILHMQGCLDQVLQDLDSVLDNSETPVVEEHAVEIQPAVVVEELLVEQEPVVIEEPPVLEEFPVVEEPISPILKGSAVESIVTTEVLIEEEYKPSVLGESIKMAAGLRHAISLNDSFRFARELFGGDSELMNRVVEQLSAMSSYKTALAFLSSKVDINEESEALNDFLELLKKYFNQSA
ncbi:hypothetical protein [uncultured Bacteroides sp.]|uniref:hypothetical protein n=1 Tax=uncultured Bacteroides sp. TaxID=162156 RepID=UPI0025FF29F0|nr:hypothetical protein [uncultured Bacteroides sp.]